MNKKKVLLGMSGGIDSTVSAKILLDKGYEVIGVFMQMIPSHKKKYESVKSISQKLGIEVFRVNVSQEFKKEVIDDFVKKYESGRTPNPCVMCNPRIKFKKLLELADKKNIDYVSTGHYARIEKKVSDEKEIYELKEGIDKKKDQSYFLYNLGQKELRRIIFPLGDYIKNNVKNIAYKEEIFDKNKKESQDICFIEDNDTKNFLSKFASKLKKNGNVVDKSGVKIGSHKGLIYYTVGQRSNISDLCLKKSKMNIDKDRIPPLYVIKLDIVKNQLVLGKKEDLFEDTLVVEDVNWIDSRENEKIFCVEAKIRSSGKKSKCMLKYRDNNLFVKFEKKQRAIASGQSIVFYKNNIVLGGGVIK